MIALLCFCLFILMVSGMLTWFLRRYALLTHLLDIPNHRSSHIVPTPGGGGLAFVLCFNLVVLSLTFLRVIPFNLFLLFAGIGTLVAMLGFIDDYRPIPAKWRLTGHFAACGFALYLLGGMPAVSILSWTVATGLFSNILAVFYLVWLLNLYNFMDGIDGIAAVEAITVCSSGALLYFFHGFDIAMLLPIGLAVSVGGFLFWNFPVARIFMGDAGSGFLGFVLGMFSLMAATINANFFWSWLILLGVFIVDASITLLRRAMTGKRLSEAHCSHAYQHACRYYGSHRAVTLRVLAINLLWLLPMAIAVANNLIGGFSGLFIAYTPIIVLAFVFNAGKEGSTS